MFRADAAAHLAAQFFQLRSRRALVGFDGFVDTIVTAVATRSGPGDAFTPIATVTEFGERVLAAAGKSTNIELYPRIEKLGGNGPIMANALRALGAGVTYIGAVGEGDGVHPAFAGLAADATVVPLCPPAQTTAIEFGDGKLMLGSMRALEDVSYARICAKMGEGRFHEAIAEADVVALVNWTMVPGMSGLFSELLTTVLPRLPGNPHRLFFFDLADPEKRSDPDLKDALLLITAFRPFGRVTLGLNLKEAQHLARLLRLPMADETEPGLRHLGAKVRAELQLDTVVVHPRHCAACATADGTAFVDGPFTATPRISTGAGDHFNAGFVAGQLLGLDPVVCLELGVATSGYYVRTAQGPTAAALVNFIGEIVTGRLSSPWLPGRVLHRPRHGRPFAAKAAGMARGDASERRRDRRPARVR